MSIKPYETEAGFPSRGIVFKLIIEHLRDAQTQMFVMKHLFETSGEDQDTLIALAWTQMGESMEQIIANLTLLGQGKTHK